MKQITEDYVSFEIAKLLKEKGFDEPCIGFYNPITGSLHESCVRKSWDYNRHGSINAPTHQMAMAWLREEKKVFIYVEPFITINYKGRNLEGYKPWICTLDSEGSWVNPLNSYAPTYEGAVSAALKYSLENLI